MFDKPIINELRLFLENDMQCKNGQIEFLVKRDLGKVKTNIHSLPVKELSNSTTVYLLNGMMVQR